MNTNSAVIDKDFITIGQFKRSKTVSICFISKVVQAKYRFVITYNPHPKDAAKEYAKNIIEEKGQPWEEINDKDIVKTSMKLFPTKDGFKFSKDGREYMSVGEKEKRASPPLLFFLDLILIPSYPCDTVLKSSTEISLSLFFPFSLFHFSLRQEYPSHPLLLCNSGISQTQERLRASYP